MRSTNLNYYMNMLSISIFGEGPPDFTSVKMDKTGKNTLGNYAYVGMLYSLCYDPSLSDTEKVNKIKEMITQIENKHQTGPLLRLSDNLYFDEENACVAIENIRGELGYLLDIFECLVEK